MPDEETIERARKDKEEGKSPGTQAGEFVREEIDHVRRGKHGARSAKQAIAIGLSKARRAGVKLPPPAKAKASRRTSEQAERDYRKGQRGAASRPSKRRSRAASAALKKERREAASHDALRRQARSSAQRRTSRHRAAEKAVRTKNRAGLKRVAPRKGARSRRSES